MPDVPQTGPAGSLDFFLGELKSDMKVLMLTTTDILARLKAGDQRFEHTDNRIERIELSLATLETDRLAAAQQLERSATAAALALERAAAAASAALADTQKRRLTRRDGVVIVGAGAAFSSLVVILQRVWDAVTQHVSTLPH